MQKSKLDTAIEAIASSCLNQGIKLTTKRRNIMVSLLGNQKPISAYALAERYTEDHGERIPAMSVYRILDFFVKKNIVHKLSSTNKYVACSHITCDHAHQVPQFLICSQCGNVNEMGVERKIVDQLKNSVEKTGFKLDQQQLELIGICQTCQPPE